MTRQAFAVCIVTCVCAAFGVSPLHAQSLGPPGATWGGDHVRLQVTESGAVLDFDCSRGVILKPLSTNSQGRFKVNGTFTRERGGPITKDNSGTAKPAAYSGSITGDTMKLSVTVGSQNESVGDFVLVRGNPGHVVKCR